MAIKKDELDTWLESLNTMYHGTVKTSTRTSIRIVNSPVIKELLNINLDSLYELYGNLILAGFEKDEAITIIVSVIRDYEQRTA
jgi:hypothetical protein